MSEIIRLVRWLVCLGLLALAGVALAQTPGDDPFAWLEDIHGARALAWVAQQNARTAAVLEADPRFELFRRQALTIFTAKDRIPYPGFLADGVDNLWQDEAHAHGLWRRTSLAAYATLSPDWDVMLDLDQLSRTEGKSWFWKGATCLRPAERYCLVRLSNGGGDAVRVREFDTLTKHFVAGGFDFPVGKQYVDWLDRDTLIVGRDWSGAGADLTASGYPYVLKIIKRGQGVDQSRTVFRGSPTDVWAEPRVFFGAGRPSPGGPRPEGSELLRTNLLPSVRCGAGQAALAAQEHPSGACSRPADVHHPAGLGRFQSRGAPGL